MVLLVGALVAGILTTLAPCVLPLLPVIVGGSVVPLRRRTATVGAVTATSTATATSPTGVEPRRTARAGTRPGPGRAVIVTASLGLSVIMFTLLLKASTALIGVPGEVWRLLSGGLLVVLGLTQLFPAVWESVSTRLTLGSRTANRLAAARSESGAVGAVLTGAALGPVFSSCSPLYGYLVVTVLPAEPIYGLALLVAYVTGLCATLLAVALAGQRLIRRLRWAADPHGWFRRTVGLLLLAVGVLVLSGLDLDVQTWILDHSPVQPWGLDAGFIPAE